MKNIVFLSLLCFSFTTYSQVITEADLNSMIAVAQEKSVGAHQSIVQQTSEEFANSIWGKTVRFNQAKIMKFFTHPSGEKVSAGVDIHKSSNNSWGYSYDQKVAADLLTANGVRVTPSFNTLWISANQTLLSAKNETEGHGTVLELYCPQQKFLTILRMGQTQSIEFYITGYKGSTTSNSKIYGVLTQVNVEMQMVKCSNGHSFDKDAGYKFCPTCGEPLE